MPRIYTKLSDEHKRKISLALKGKPHRKEWVEKQRLSQLGKSKKKGIIPWNKGLIIQFKYSEESKQKMRESKIGEKNKAWKGEKAGYKAIHRWVIRNLGQPSLCEICGRTDRKKYEWANKDHSYKRNTTDWIRLCCSCHQEYDSKNNGYIKGRKDLIKKISKDFLR